MPCFVDVFLMPAGRRGLRGRRVLQRRGDPPGEAAMTALAPMFGILASLLAVADVVPYLRDTVRRSTRPHRATWLVWAVLAVMVCCSQRADGASWSLAMAVTQAILTVLVFVLAIPLGEGRVSPRETTLLAIAAAGAIGWVLADAAVVATTCVVVADLAAAAMMVPKTWRDPDSETLSTFDLSCAGGALAAMQRVADILRPEPDPMRDKLITAADVAARFGVSRTWVYDNAELLGAIRLGTGAKARLRFDPARVLEFIQANRSSHDAMARRSPSATRWLDAADLIPIRGQ
jgi:hypothetical protein